jgi:hypothetical protein
VEAIRLGYKSSEKEKLKWTVLLFLAGALFLVSLSTQLYAINIIVIGLSLHIYRNGSSILFREYEERQIKKLEDVKLVREATQTVLESNKIFKKRGNENV